VAKSAVGQPEFLIYIGNRRETEERNSVPFGFFLPLFFDPEDGCDMFLRNVG
jgi:hypothetical protein